MSIDTEVDSFRRQAEHYVRQCLEQGNTLAQILLREFKIEKCRIRTCFPPHVSLERLSRFSEGGISSQRNARHWLLEQIKEYLSREANGIVCFENATVKRGDPFLARCHSSIAFIGDEVVHFIPASGASSSTILTTVAEAESFHLFIGFFSRLPETTGLPQHCDEIAPELITLLVRGACQLILGAYDGEGYIVCD